MSYTGTMRNHLYLIVGLLVLLLAVPRAGTTADQRGTTIQSPGDQPANTRGNSSQSKPSAVHSKQPDTDTGARVQTTDGTDSPVRTAERRIRSGDVLSINLIGEEWGGEFEVPPSGRVDFQFIGTLDLIGKTRSQVNDLLVKKLQPAYFRNPELQINYESFGSISVLVLGAVGEPKRVELDHHSGVMDALTKAGNLTKFSERVKMYVFRQHDNGDTSVHFADYERYVSGQLNEDVPLQENDVVYVRSNFWPHFDTLDEVLGPMGFTINTIDTVQDLQD